MKQFLLQLKGLSPAAVLTWLEQGAEWIHQLPYRFAAWLPQVPGLWRRMWCAVFAWMNKKDITPRLKIMAPLCLGALILPFCLQKVENEPLTYLLTTGTEPTFIVGYPDAEQTAGGLQIHAGESSRDAQLVLDQGQRISVRFHGQTLSAVSRRETVANLLRRLGVEVGRDEMVVVNVADKSPSIAIQRVYYYDWEKNTPLDYTTEYVPAPLVEKGQETELQPGSKGNLLQVYRNIYREGTLSATELVSEVVTEPTNQIIEQGTRVQEVSRDDRIKEVFYNADGSGYLLFESGETMTFSEKVTCNATAYSIGSWTASGLPTKVGHIAVDTSVFPYHTRFYIYTNDGYLVYGNAVAADCGSAIKGYKIDLWFETFDEACWFGRRDCTVFVLN